MIMYMVHEHYAVSVYLFMLSQLTSLSILKVIKILLSFHTLSRYFNNLFLRILTDLNSMNAKIRLETSWRPGKPKQALTLFLSLNKALVYIVFRVCAQFVCELSVSLTAI